MASKGDFKVHPGKRKNEICFEIEDPATRIAALKALDKLRVKQLKPKGAPKPKQKIRGVSAHDYHLTNEGVRKTGADKNDPTHSYFKAKRASMGIPEPETGTNVKVTVKTAKAKPKEKKDEKKPLTSRGLYEQFGRMAGLTPQPRPPSYKPPTPAPSKRQVSLPATPTLPGETKKDPKGERSEKKYRATPISPKRQKFIDHSKTETVKQDGKDIVLYKTNDGRVLNQEEGTMGYGNKPHTTYDSQIDKFLAKTPGYLGTAAMDKLNDVKFSPSHDSSVVLNSDTSDGPGQHWAAIWMSPTKDKTVELFDSLADQSPLKKGKVVEILRKKVDEMNLPYRLKFKVNSNRDQRANSNTCGQFACKFIADRARGKSFAEATGYDGIMKAEGAMKPLVKEFQYL